MVGYWTAYFRDPKDDAKWQRWAAVSEHLDYLIDCEPWEAWALIAAIHVRDQSAAVNQSLCPGPLESLLANHGTELIDTVTGFARKNPSFAALLRAAWRGGMEAEVWKGCGRSGSGGSGGQPVDPDRVDYGS